LSKNKLLTLEDAEHKYCQKAHLACGDVSAADSGGGRYDSIAGLRFCIERAASVSFPNPKLWLFVQAAEALGAIGSEVCLSLLEERAYDAAPEVAETCQLALRRIAHKQAETDASTQSSPFTSVDPAPAANVNATDSELR
jgi:hypothetical protein